MDEDYKKIKKLDIVAIIIFSFLAILVFIGIVSCNGSNDNLSTFKIKTLPREIIEVNLEDDVLVKYIANHTLIVKLDNHYEVGDTVKYSNYYRDYTYIIIEKY